MNDDSRQSRQVSPPFEVGTRMGNDWWRNLRKEIDDAEVTAHFNIDNAMMDAADLPYKERAITDALLAVESRLEWLGLLMIYLSNDKE